MNNHHYVKVKNESIEEVKELLNGNEIKYTTFDNMEKVQAEEYAERSLGYNKLDFDKEDEEYQNIEELSDMVFGQLETSMNEDFVTLLIDISKNQWQAKGDIIENE